MFFAVILIQRCRLLLHCMLNLFGVKGFNTPSFLFSKLAEVLVIDVTFVASIERLEDHVHHVHLESNPHAVEGFLKLSEGYSVAVVSIEEPICLCHGLESLLELDPEEVEHLIELSACFLVLMGMTFLSICRQYLIDFLWEVIVYFLFQWQ